jgi:hydrogenase maturation protease
MSDLRGIEGLLVIGVGNRWRRDDGVGPWVADRLREQGLPVLEHSGEGAGLIAAWSEARSVIVVDATTSGSPIGTLHRLDAVAAELPRNFFRYSSHLFGLAEAISTARTLGRLPPHLIVHGIEGGDFGFGETLSPEVAAAAATTVQRILEEVRSLETKASDNA